MPIIWHRFPALLAVYDDNYHHPQRPQAPQPSKLKAKTSGVPAVTHLQALNLVPHRCGNSKYLDICGCDRRGCVSDDRAESRRWSWSRTAEELLLVWVSEPGIENSALRLERCARTMTSLNRSSTVAILARTVRVDSFIVCPHQPQHHTAASHRDTSLRYSRQRKRSSSEERKFDRSHKWSHMGGWI